MKPLIILTGPTAVGKTELSISLARAVNGEIVSADSMQVYKKMDIGSAKIRPEEMGNVPHHLIDILDPRDSFDVVTFQRFAKKAVTEIHQRGRIPVLTGGTGFYIQSVVYDIDFTKADSDDSFRRHLEALAAERGGEFLHGMLRERDPQAAGEIHPRNVKRVIRALEFYQQTGMRISEHNEEQRQKASPYQFLYLVLNDRRERLYQRIDARVDQMIREGLLKEVQELRDMGCTRDMTSMKGLGYKEILAYLDGEYTLEEAIRILKRDTRHFAKRQLTWFKRERDVSWIQKDEFDYDNDRILSYILELVREKNMEMRN
ncbi:tRNA (adenosine(37)-N6)-dimethylallyltransferase MiaA [Ruminococcus sp. OA3]|uniref:tRNA (adenosine(37)-N6)-dimethylallyltransferase MiaA n=1 Tax=Ruminococcus sp. OA3 TaxID=2914164 RepID=UPI001F05B59D|nr:tRNA (adenosine(37)-N6)-dimethylallyltransferase MiaA [Ruminococcus sp. OA3]MCH1983325.1 tRNA (adenosine(37)-N6)-dimethylallyltransferase MiaA [Ruminococcus sp. OA3]